ncbi:MAG: FAD-dependent monooxygenase, partial [Lautropia sp.]
MDFVSYFDYVHYPAVLPPLTGGADPRRHPVAIVGGGPIGLALAVGLARHGVASVVLEADDSVCTGSRAGCVTDRTLQIFDQFGCAEPVMRQGLPWAEGWSYYRTDEVFHLQVPQDPLAKFPRLVNIQQCYLEQYLLEAAGRYRDLIEIRWQNRVAGVEVRADGARLAVETPLGDYALDCDWVVAGDGARSTVRKAIGARFVGTQYDGTYIIADIKMKSALPAGRRAWFDPPSNPGATLLLHKHRDDLWRFDYQLRRDEDPDEAVKPANVLARIRSHLELIGETAPWQPVWISLYKASCLTLERYRFGRAILAGDAAHLVPIFGVRGLNSGVDDTHNLAWKLAFVIRGWADPRLLESYSDERVHATRVNMQNASKSCEFMDPPSPAFALMRTAALSLARDHAWIRRLVDPRQSAAIGYPDTPLRVADDDADFAAGPSIGINVFDTVLPNRGHLSERLGPQFTVLRFDPAGAGGAAAAGAAVAGTAAGAAGSAAIDAAAFAGRVDVPAPVAVVDLPAASVVGRRYDARAGTVYLFRPVGHVLARWRAADPA